MFSRFVIFSFFAANVKDILLNYFELPTLFFRKNQRLTLRMPFALFIFTAYWSKIQISKSKNFGEIKC